MAQFGARVSSRLRYLRELLRYWLGLGLHKLIGRRDLAARLDPAQIHSVLVCRINGRLGNALFLTPMLQRLHALLPEAQIDLALSYPHAAALLAGMPGVRRVIVFPHKGRAIIPLYVSALRQLRSTQYDLAIDPTLHSTSGRLILSLTRSRFRLGFSLVSQWAPLTHAVPMPTGTLHQARMPALLVTEALGGGWDPAAIRLWLPLNGAEIAAGRAAIDAATGGASHGPRVGYFAHATGLKALPATWWAGFWPALLALHPDLEPVEFLPTPAATPTVSGIAALCLPSQRQLTAAISTLQLFISADAGPMHLASTTDTPTMGLFQVTDPAMYGPLKRVDRSIDVAERTPQEVAAQIGAAWSVLGK